MNSLEMLTTFEARIKLELNYSRKIEVLYIDAQLYCSKIRHWITLNALARYVRRRSTATYRSTGLKKNYHRKLVVRHLEKSNTRERYIS